MRLKRLELFGFKSFADRTVLDFPHAFTGIVGPNGCGKSNVVDAVRWVLGETRPTSMRGGEMTDVIFKGSTSRPAVSVAEVTLVVDNTCGTIPAHGAEVAVTRRVFRSGEGEYEIDGSRVRLKDVRDLLFDTGLGSRGYSVLEQGKIDAVLSANPHDRRAIFEEAAGVSRFRQRRKETESRLKRVDQDLERLDDVVGELESRVRSLKVQAGRARTWVEVRDEWRERGVKLAQHQLLTLDGALSTTDEELLEVDAVLAGLREQRESAEHDLAEREAEQAQLAGRVDEAGAALSEVSGELLTLDERSRQLSARVDAWRATAEAEARRVDELGERLGLRGAELEAARAEREQATSDAERAESALEELGGAFREAARRYREARHQSEEQSKRVNGLIHDKASAYNAARQLESSLGPLTERAERAEVRLTELRERLAAARQEWTSAEGALAEAEGACTAAQEEHAELTAGLQRLRETESGCKEERRRIEVERAALRSRVEALLDWERERESLDAGARSLLEGQGPIDADVLGGLLADHVHTTPEYARALDAALGLSAEAIVLQDESEAAAIGAWLKEREIGQARLVVPGGLNRGNCEPVIPEVSIDLREHVHGLLLEHVRVSTELIPVAHLLLCDCILVSDLESALALTEELPGWRLVTPEGDLVDATGVLAGYREVQQGAVGRRAQAAELESEAAALDTRLDELAVEEERARAEREALEVRLTAAAEAVERARAAYASATSRLRTAEVRTGDAERGLGDAEAESVGLIDERARAEERLVELRREHEHAERAFELENSRLEELEKSRHAIEAERDETGREEHRARVEMTRAREQAQALERRLSDLGRVVEELQLEIERARRLARENESQAEEGGEESQAIGARRAELEIERSAAAEELERRRNEERSGRERIDTLRRGADVVTRELEGLMARRGERQLDRQRAELSREELLRRSEDDFKLDAEALREDFEPSPELLEAEHLEALEVDVLELKRKLDRLGPVNLEAVEELEGVAERLEFLTTQRSDLIEAKSELVSTLETINSESERLFLEAFEEIRGHFRTIFRQLFGGGKADVELAEGEPVLEAGIEITARPPGRETLPIGLLSGGQRTMTALALLFAVFKSRPSPFCVLDEVDAALDDANVGRFLSMLDGFVADTQFIVVTHNKGTMAASDMLYGVTMETKGVSRNVSVELSDVDNFVPEAIGDARAAAQSHADTSAAAAQVGDEDADDEPVVELAPHEPTRVDVPEKVESR
ncbi:chromosome segregation protein SMC [Engelhardtia mirabilis]|uniref:Chromosome partition protein Smc n=1 Tax=Engelhardtia mirabilis TaxID=2528011 RepID=A0A518BJC8_9BACT|nr:Chromosome partition protein Smc [Planctomycetes bacterium Pla133]QDV01395.1 Chromosome partition protein Smc [Planctomycetes bacterium Pla86]